MERLLPRRTLPGASGRATQAGITLVEVLVAIFIMGIGLLALLTLFPLGALEMARAIPDDRTAAVAADAVALSQAGEALISRTAHFVEASLSTGSADPQTAARLREEYEHFALQAEAIEAKLLALQSAFPPEQIEPYLSRLLAQIRSIQRRIFQLARLLSVLETGELRTENILSPSRIGTGAGDMRQAARAGPD